MDDMNTIKVRPVTASRWRDFEKLFEYPGAPKYCWCMAWRARGDETRHTDSSHRKKFMKERIQKKIPVGLLAYTGKEPIAWCSISPRETYRELGGDDTVENVWSLVCFYIKKDFRKRKLTIHLIKEAIEYAKKKGAQYVEAYPVDESSPSYRFMGFVNTFKKLGFEFIKKAGTRRNVMLIKTTA